MQALAQAPAPSLAPDAVVEDASPSAAPGPEVEAAPYLSPAASPEGQPLVFLVQLSLLAAENASVLVSQADTFKRVIAGLFPDLQPEQVRLSQIDITALPGRRLLLDGNATVDVQVTINPADGQRPQLAGALGSIQDDALTSSLQAAGLPVLSASLVGSLAPGQVPAPAASPLLAPPPVVIVRRHSGNVPLAALLGAIAGAVVLLLILSGIAFCCYLRSRRRRGGGRSHASHSRKALSAGDEEAAEPESPVSEAPSGEGRQEQRDVSRLLALATHKHEKAPAAGRFYRAGIATSSAHASASVPFLEQQQREAAAAALRDMAADGRLFAGRFRLQTESMKLRGPKVELLCTDSHEREGERLKATFFVRDDDFEHEIALRSLVPPASMLAGVVATYAREPTITSTSLPSCIVTAAGSYSLAQWMHSNRGHPHPSQLLAIVESMTAAVASFHSAGFVHGGVRPEVVLRFSRENVARLADTSAMSLVRHPCTTHPVPRYAAPEMSELKLQNGPLRILKASTAADMWSLGCVIFELYTGRPIFDGRYTDDEVAISLSSADLLPWALNPEFFEDAISNAEAREAVHNLLRWAPQERWDTHALLASQLLSMRSSRSGDASLLRTIQSADMGAQLAQLTAEPAPPKAPMQPPAKAVAAAQPPEAVAPASPVAVAAPSRWQSPRVYQPRAARKVPGQAKAGLASPFDANARDWVLAESDMQLQPLPLVPHYSCELGSRRQSLASARPTPYASRRASMAEARPELAPAPAPAPAEDGIQEAPKAAKADGVKADLEEVRALLSNGAGPCTPQPSAEPRQRSALRHQALASSELESLSEEEAEHGRRSSTTEPLPDSAGPPAEERSSSGEEPAAESPRKQAADLSFRPAELQALLAREAAARGASLAQEREALSAARASTSEGRHMRQLSLATSVTEPLPSEPELVQSEHEPEPEQAQTAHALAAANLPGWQLSSKWTAAAEQQPTAALQRRQSTWTQASASDTLSPQNSSKALPFNTSVRVLEDGASSNGVTPSAVSPAKVSPLRPDLYDTGIWSLASIGEVDEASPAGNSAAAVKQPAALRAVTHPASQAAAAPAPKEMPASRVRHWNSALLQLLHPTVPSPAQPQPQTEPQPQTKPQQQPQLKLQPSFNELQRQRAELGGALSLQPVPAAALPALRGSLLVVSTRLAKVTDLGVSEATVLKRLRNKAPLSSREIRAIARSGLGDEPLFPVQLGGLYLLRLRVAAGSPAGRQALMVEGVSELRLFTSADDAGTPLEVVAASIDADGSAWEGTAVWDTNVPAMAYLASQFGQHTCLRLELTLPAKGEAGADFTLQQHLFALVSTKRQSALGARFERSDAFAGFLSRLPWAAQEAHGVVVFATVVRRTQTLTGSESDRLLLRRSEIMAPG